MRARFWFWLKRSFGVSEGARISALLLVVGCIIFPRRLLWLLAERILPVSYDFACDVFVIEGMRFSREFLVSRNRGEFRVGGLVLDGLIEIRDSLKLPGG